jgi:hypothetical protein
MAYATTNPPRIMVSGVGTGGPSWWSYDSADAATTVRADTYISDADDLGMKVGDIIIQSSTVASAVAHIYSVITINADGSADLTDGTAIDVTNS